MSIAAPAVRSLAAALAYYTTFALPPLVYLLLTILTFSLSLTYDNEQAERRALGLLSSQTAQMMGNPAISDQISTIIENNRQSSEKWWKTALSFVGIIFGATGVAAALQAALNQVWVYYTSMIVRLGAEATQVYAVRYGNGLEPEEYAVRLVQQFKRSTQNKEPITPSPITP